MSTLTLRRYERSLLADGIVAGLIAGAIVDAFLFATGVLTWPHAYMFIASALVGKTALTSTAYVPLGIALHFMISAAWGAIFGLAAKRYPALVDHPTLAGLAYGIVVLVGMQALLFADGIWRAPANGGQIVLDVVAHSVFFALPLAWYVHAAARAHVRAALS